MRKHLTCLLIFVSIIAYVFVLVAGCCGPSQIQNTGAEPASFKTNTIVPVQTLSDYEKDLIFTATIKEMAEDLEDKLQDLSFDFDTAHGGADYNGMKKNGKMLAERALFWQKKLDPLPVSVNLTEYKKWTLSALKEQEGTGESSSKAGQLYLERQKEAADAQIQTASDHLDKASFYQYYAKSSLPGEGPAIAQSISFSGKGNFSSPIFHAKPGYILIRWSSTVDERSPHIHLNKAGKGVVDGHRVENGLGSSNAENVEKIMEEDDYYLHFYSGYQITVTVLPYVLKKDEKFFG